IHDSPHAPTGIATIILSENDNRIIVSPGANAALTPQKVKDASEMRLSCDVILLQFEIPMETIQCTFDFAYKHLIQVIINPAPFRVITVVILKKRVYF